MNYQNLKCSELKDLLAKRGLPSHGKKNELLERLLKHEEKDNMISLTPYLLNKNNNSNDSTASNIDVSEEKVEYKSTHPDINIEYSSTKEDLDKCNYKSSYIGGENKKKIITVNNKEDEFNKGELSKMKNYFKNILTVNATTEGSKYYENPKLNDEKKTNENKNEKDSNEEEKKTKVVIPQITFSESSLSTKNTLQKNIPSSSPEDNIYLTEEKKRELRKKRFGFVSTDEALESRAKRFCIVTQKMEEENKKKRAERFGLNLGKLNDVDTKRKRAERFGLTKESDKLKARALRFGMAK
ncbi:SAP domain-containing protein, putative [Plasmodium ovale]|uniref:SAP domain-containing protein, putative n=1 Tax=Plasmodium ovale TaxID=36330 RepID=A0A1C3KQD5_PLAOA|nr:SAP domain-containing protein, putative [Plasmodium ovale]